MLQGNLFSGAGASAIAREDQRFVSSIVQRIRSLTERQGIETSRHTAYWYIKTSEELDDLFGFSFWSEGVYSQFGGERVRVWYHPDSEKSDETLVLDVEWWDVQDCKVKHLDNSMAWRLALLTLLEARGPKTH